jgi:hypothetical protein
MPQNEERICTLMNILNINERVDEEAFDANKKKHRKHELLLERCATNERCATSECYK